MIIHKDKNIVSFTKVKLPYGWMGNMSPYSIEFEGGMWYHTEGLFQALRMKNSEIVSMIQKEKNPMKAKMISKKYKEYRVVAPFSETDIDNMKLCLQLKFNQHPELKEQLIETQDSFIIEDVTSRMSGSGVFWGMGLVENYWIGENKLGNLLMELRREF